MMQFVVWLIIGALAGLTSFLLVAEYVRPLNRRINRDAQTLRSMPPDLRVVKSLDDEGDVRS